MKEIIRPEENETAKEKRYLRAKLFEKITNAAPTGWNLERRLTSHKWKL